MSRLEPRRGKTARRSWARPEGVSTRVVVPRGTKSSMWRTLRKFLRTRASGVRLFCDGRTVLDIGSLGDSVRLLVLQLWMESLHTVTLP